MAWVTRGLALILLVAGIVCGCIVSADNVTLTVLNQTVITPPAGGAYIPVEMYNIVVMISFVMFLGSLYIRQADDITATLSGVLFYILAWMTPNVAFDFSLPLAVNGGGVGNVSVVIVPYLSVPFDPYMAYFWLMFGFLGTVNIWRVIHRNMMEAVKEREEMRSTGKGW
jgi:hypothetical protein